MSSIKETSRQSFDACESGKGWQGCQQYCHPGATFSAQPGALANVSGLQFDGDKIGHMTKIWNDSISLTQLGWT